MQQLHQLLIQPIAGFLPKDPNARVIFIPHQKLFLVPFAALQDNFGKYLIEQHTILTAPSIQTLDCTRLLRQRIVGKDMLVMGNPAMPSIRELPTPLPPLPGAEREAIEIASLFNTQAIIGKDATKAAFLERLSSARFIHLATHGVLYDFGSGVSGAIALAPSSDDDGWLTAGEVLGLKLNAELVVLSACHTGGGKITSDGVISLSRSFIAAGAGSVIAALWTVYDFPTDFFISEFYSQLLQNRDKAQALRQAMLSMMQKYPHPKYWAVFTLIGEAE
jgi:CHAT domain-containing protein